MNRLWVRLTLAFGLVILVAVGTVAILAALTAGQAFRSYLTYSDMLPYQSLVGELADYYRVEGTWRGVDRILEQAAAVRDPMMGMRRDTRSLLPPGAGLQLVLADADGWVIFDGLDGRPGRRLSRDERAAAQDIESKGEVVGQLIATIPVRSRALGPLEHIFLARLRLWLIIGAVLAGGFGLLLGVLLSRSLTAPLQRLAAAARFVAARDFSRRLEPEGSAEVGEVALAFNEMTAALEQSERQRQDLVADVAHELRTPLSVLQGNLRAILDGMYPLDKAEISRLYDETRLLSRLVDDLRELALADAGQLRLNLRSTDLAQVIGPTLDALSLAAEAQGIVLGLEIPDDCPFVQADPDRLAQVVRNLLANGMRHTPAGGSVIVRVRPTGDTVEVAVVDTGVGITAEDLPHVFDRFWRTDPARTRVSRADNGRWAGGSGLGLSIAHSLVEAMGGRIWVESQPGQGSTFRFTLPSA